MLRVACGRLLGPLARAPLLLEAASCSCSFGLTSHPFCTGPRNPRPLVIRHTHTRACSGAQNDTSTDISNPEPAKVIAEEAPSSKPQKKDLQPPTLDSLLKQGLKPTLYPSEASYVLIQLAHLKRSGSLLEGQYVKEEGFLNCLKNLERSDVQRGIKVPAAIACIKVSRSTSIEDLSSFSGHI